MIGGWELATKAGHEAIGLRRTLGHIRIREHIENREKHPQRHIELKTCPDCDAVFPAVTFCLDCGAELGVRDFADPEPARGHAVPDRLASTGLVTVGLGVNGVAMGWLLSPAGPYVGVAAIGTGVFLVLSAMALRRSRLSRAIADQDRKMRRVRHVDPVGPKRNLASAQAWLLLLLVTILVVPPAIVWFQPSRAMRRAARGSKRSRDEAAVGQTVVVVAPVEVEQEPLPLNWTDDPVCEAATGQLEVHARYPGGRDEAVAVTVTGHAAGTTPWSGLVDAGVTEVVLGGLTFGVVVPEDGSTVVLDDLAVAVPSDWVAIPGGRFGMGAPSGYGFHFPPHEVAVPAFEMWRTEVTVEQYRRCVDAGACEFPLRYVAPGAWGRHARDQHPITLVTWEEAVTFCAWVGGRLPSESEWEYAARGGGRDIVYPWGNAPATCEHAVMDDDGPGCGMGDSWDVCSKPDGNTAQGLCDMSGNVWEWARDSFSYWYLSSPDELEEGQEECYSWAQPFTGCCAPPCSEEPMEYEGPPVDGSAWECPTLMDRVIRGGSYRSSADEENAIHLFISDEVGFRCARDAL